MSIKRVRFLTQSFYFLKTELLYLCFGLRTLRRPKRSTTDLTGFLGYRTCGFQPRSQGLPLQGARRRETLGTKLTCTIVLN